MAVSPTKKRILDEASKLFQENGYLAASMRDLAKRVGLQVSSLYSHVGSKEELLQKICFDSARVYLEGMKTIEETDASPSEKVRQLIALHIQIATTDVTSMTIFSDEWRHLSEPYLQEFRIIRRDYERRFGRMLQQGVDAGEFAEMNVTICLLTIFTSLRWLHRWYPEKRGISVKSLETEILRFLFEGLKKH
ncbi:MAG: TetR/AcrR family transcriptional regulator [Saprospiraceae bacterium]|nr:TetR/AcrR family transcriptional regulator [Saprospiraceae bacterium]